ncbi:MAG: restriction endonuclease subunit S [Gammaproteobacteria bacterium]|nr:restriction endonuclease subunit S [Gammaproteobacteria bacterium]
MIPDLKPYAAMKDSGVPWLGKVPEHWEIRPIARMGQLFKGKGGNKEDEVVEGVPCVRYGDLYTRHEFFIRSTKADVSAERASAYTPIQFGDLLFAASGETIEDIGRSAVNLLTGSACCGGDVLVFRPLIPIEPRFLGYAADAPPARHQKAGMGRGFTVVHIYGSQLKRLMLPLPPLPEQVAIVRYLDHMDRRIRRYIRAKQKLIKLLEEQKQAIIHRAVTRGLDPNVRLKPSGVEWLGDVPEHWEIKRGKYYFREIDIRSGAGQEELLSVSHITGVTPRSQKNITMFKAESYVGSKICTPGQIAVNTMWAWMGAIGVSGYHGLISPSYHTYEQIDSGRFADEYLDLLLRTTLYKNFYTANSSGITTSRLRLYPDDFLNIRFLCPPRPEQDAILEWLHDATADIDATIGRASREIGLLREYRTRLIADVVTGKLDVREVAARLPDEAEEPEVFDDADAMDSADGIESDEFDATIKEAET